MKKYSIKFKINVVKYCLKGYGYEETAKHFGIPEFSIVRNWLKIYEKHGKNGFKKSSKPSYSGEFKLNVLEYMHSNHLSLLETSTYFNITGKCTVSKWERIYNEEGPEALLKEQQGQNKNMNSKPSKKKIKEKRNEKEILEELEYLKAENEYLKKLNALVQERIKQEKKKK